MLIPIDAFWSERKNYFLFKKYLCVFLNRSTLLLALCCALYNLFSVVFPYLSKLLFTLYNVNWVGTAAAQTQYIHTVRKHEESATTYNIKISKDDKYFTTTHTEASRHLNSNK